MAILDVTKLDWSRNDADFVRNHFNDVDLIIAADVIYDSSLFDALLSTVRMLFNCCDNCNQFMLVNAVRNPETEHEFLAKLGKNLKQNQEISMKRKSLFHWFAYVSPFPDAFGFQYHEEPSIQPKLLNWQPNDFSPIKLYSIFNK